MRKVRPVRVREPLSTFSKVILSVLAVLCLLMLALGITVRCGLMLTNMKIYAWLLIGLVLTLIVWGCYAICNKIQNRKLRIGVLLVMGFVLMLAVSVVLSLVSYFYTYAVSSKYAEVVSDTGRKLVVMRRYDLDEEKLRDRYPDAGEELMPQTEEDFNYYYSAFPKKLWFFVDANAEAEGVIIISVDSEAKLMVEWPDENTAHLYVENPGPYDSGEITVKFEE